MRVNSINYANQINTFSFAKSIHKANNISFSSKHEDTYNKRKEQLDKLGISDEAVKKISHYGEARYARAINLLTLGCYEENIEKASRYHDKKYRRANELLRHNIFDMSLTSLVKLNDQKFERTIDLADKGIDSDCLVLYSQLNSKEYDNSIKCMKDGYTPISSVYIAKLTPKKQSEYIEMIQKGFSPENAYDIVKLKNKEKQQALEYINEGIPITEAINISLMEEAKRQRAIELIKRNISDSAAVDIADLPEEEKTLANKMIEEGVYSECISDIAGIETGRIKVPEYNEYRKRNYSRTSSYALAMFSENEGEVVTALMNKNPEIENLFKEEYYIELQTIQNINVVEIVLTKESILPDGTKITIKRTFDENGEKSISRTEETPNHATSSILSGASDIYRIKYDKTGDIREMDRIALSPETDEVIGVYHMKQSPLLKGVYETIFYDINSFKTSTDNENINDNIEDSVNKNGVAISTVNKKEDGTIVFNEIFPFSGYTTKRHYEELKDNSGNIKTCNYSYEISDEAGNTVMETSRSYTKNDDSHVINVINGISYELLYNDDNRTVTISDGNKSKIISFKDKSAVYSEDVIWEIVKKLQADTLLTLEKNIDKWNYCENSDSGANGYTRTLSSGKNESIINHETGHFIDFELNKISDSNEFLDIYMNETEKFFKSVPHNEQDFALYCSPKVNADDVEGANEFVAEANMVLTSYGNSGDHLKTRPQFLVWYFPRSIAKIAELTGKTSKKSLLE